MTTDSVCPGWSHPPVMGMGHGVWGSQVWPLRNALGVNFSLLSGLRQWPVATTGPHTQLLILTLEQWSSNMHLNWSRITKLEMSHIFTLSYPFQTLNNEHQRVFVFIVSDQVSLYTGAKVCKMYSYLLEFCWALPTCLTSQAHPRCHLQIICIIKIRSIARIGSLLLPDPYQVSFRG